MKHRIQRGEAVHLAANEIFDLSADLARIGEGHKSTPHHSCRGDEVTHGEGGP